MENNKQWGKGESNIENMGVLTGEISRQISHRLDEIRYALEFQIKNAIS